MFYRTIARRKWTIICLIATISVLGLAGITCKQNHFANADTEQQLNIEKSQPPNRGKNEAANQNESRNDFTARIAANPQEVQWTSTTLFFKVMRYLTAPQTNICQLFDEKIYRLNPEEYYVGSYYLQDSLYCEYIWISNKDHLSLGFKISGLAPNIQNLENVIEAKLSKPSKVTYQNNNYMKGWYDKTYNNMKYDFEYYHDSENENQATLTMNIHPYVYH